MIRCDTLTKRYGELVAVDHLTFDVEPGTILGFLGPNGAGKSTTMKMITGFLEPDGGRVQVAGIDVARRPREAKRQMGYLPEGAPSYGEMTTLEFLEFVAAVRGLKGRHGRERLEDTIERLNLGAVLEQPIDTLSKGFRRRVGLAQAIVHDPQVMILDEPTDGLDPNQKHEVRDLINTMAKDKIIVISTHILEEVHAVCNRAIVIAHGRLVADATPSELERRAPRHNAVTVRLPPDQDTDALATLRAALMNLPAVAEVFEEPPIAEAGRGPGLTALPKDAQVILPSIINALRGHTVAINDIEVHRGRLDEVFREITRTPGTTSTASHADASRREAA